MKRSKALEALSHQHHQGLFAALQLKRAGRETAVEARQVFLDFYEREGSRHFRAEEEVLLPAFARHTGVDDPAIVRVLTEHVDLRGRGQDLECPTGWAAIDGRPYCLACHQRIIDRGDELRATRFFENRPSLTPAVSISPSGRRTFP